MTNERELLIAIQRGVVLLDTRKPGWEHSIDIGLLSMMSCVRCVLGQLYGNFFDVYPAAQGEGEDSDHAWQEAVSYGFTVPCDAFEQFELEEAERVRCTLDYEVLTRLWIQVITAKRG